MINVNTLLDTATDCLRFVTEFFEVISQSAPHIYHSALQFTPKLSIVWRLYSKHMHSQAARVVTGIPTSWDSCTASAGVAAGVPCAAWSPCGQSIVAAFGNTVQVQDSTILQRTSIFTPPSQLSQGTCHPALLTFSPDGCRVACSYK